MSVDTLNVSRHTQCHYIPVHTSFMSFLALLVCVPSPTTSPTDPVPAPLATLMSRGARARRGLRLRRV